MYCVLYGTLVLGILLKDSGVAVWSEGARVAPERPRAGRWVDVEAGHHAIGLSHPAGRMIGIGLRAREP